MSWPEQCSALIRSHSSMTGHPSIVVSCLSTSEQNVWPTHVDASASDTARRRFCSIENTRLDPTSFFPAVTKLRNRMNYCGRNSSELSCMSSADGGQSIVPRFSERPQSYYAAKKERGVLIFISPFESARASHIGSMWYGTSFSSDLREGYKIHGRIIL